MNHRSLNQTVAGALGLVYLAVGLIGFAVTSGVDFFAREGDELFGVFEINPAHNIVHLLIGAALLGAAMKGPWAARGMNLAIGGTYLLVGVLGLFLLDTDADILALNHADNALHLGTAAVLLGTALLAGGRTSPSPRDEMHEHSRTSMADHKH